MLNLSLQEKRNSVSYLGGHVVGFGSNLVLFADCLENNNLAYFPCYFVIKEDDLNVHFTQFTCNIIFLFAEFLQ